MPFATFGASNTVSTCCPQHSCTEQKVARADWEGGRSERWRECFKTTPPPSEGNSKDFLPVYHCNSVINVWVSEANWDPTFTRQGKPQSAQARNHKLGIKLGLKSWFLVLRQATVSTMTNTWVAQVKRVPSNPSKQTLVMSERGLGVPFRASYTKSAAPLSSKIVLRAEYAHDTIPMGKSPFQSTSKATCLRHLRTTDCVIYLFVNLLFVA